MDAVDEFVARYAREYDYYTRASRLATEIFEKNLHSAGVRCPVTSRAKDVARLEEKQVEASPQRIHVG